MIAANLARGMHRWLTHRIGLRCWTSDQIRYPLYDAIFNTGKQVGLIVGTLKDLGAVRQPSREMPTQ